MSGMKESATRCGLMFVDVKALALHVRINGAALCNWELWN